MKDETQETIIGDTFKVIIENNIKHFVDQIIQGRITKEEARARLKSVFGDNITIPPELQDTSKLPPNAEFTT